MQHLFLTIAIMEEEEEGSQGNVTLRKLLSSRIECQDKISQCICHVTVSFHFFLTDGILLLFTWSEHLTARKQTHLYHMLLEYVAPRDLPGPWSLEEVERVTAAASSAQRHTRTHPLRLLVPYDTVDTLTMSVKTRCHLSNDIRPVVRDVTARGRRRRKEGVRL